MNAGRIRYRPDITYVQSMARRHVGSWVGIEVHRHGPLYCWRETPVYNAFGEKSGRLLANTIYLCDHSPCPLEDLFHEIGHVVARRFDLTGHRENGFRGCWEQRQYRLVGLVSTGRHWSPMLNRVDQSASRLSPDLASELWAELFMCWFLYPEREETCLIAREMRMIRGSSEIRSIETLAERFLQ